MALDTTYVAQYGNTWWCHKCNVEVHPPTSLLSTTSSDNRCNDKHPWWRIWYYTLIDWRELSYCCNSWKVSFNFTMFSDKKMCALLLERAFEHILEVISILDDGLVTLILDWLRELCDCCTSWTVSFNFTIVSNEKMRALLLERAFVTFVEYGVAERWAEYACRTNCCGVRCCDDEQCARKALDSLPHRGEGA